jgi:hypothetical protein
MMTNPSFISSDDAIQEVTTFMVALFQKTKAHVWAVKLLPFCQMFGQPPCGKFAEHKNVIPHK